MIIKLSEDLIVASYKTIDSQVPTFISGLRHRSPSNSSNVIIHGVHIHHIVPRSGGMIRDSVDQFGQAVSDSNEISIFGSSHTWTDHVSMYKCSDGLIDVVQGSTAITISNNHFIKVAFNHFGKGLIQRMPSLVSLVDPQFSVFEALDEMPVSEEVSMRRQCGQFLPPCTGGLRAVFPQLDWPLLTDLRSLC